MVLIWAEKEWEKLLFKFCVLIISVVWRENAQIEKWFLKWAHSLIKNQFPN